MIEWYNILLIIFWLFAIGITVYAFGTAHKKPKRSLQNCNNVKRKASK